MKSLYFAFTISIASLFGFAQIASANSTCTFYSAAGAKTAHSIKIVYDVTGCSNVLADPEDETTFFVRLCLKQDAASGAICDHHEHETIHTQGSREFTNLTSETEYKILGWYRAFEYGEKGYRTIKWEDIKRHIIVTTN